MSTARFTPEKRERFMTLVEVGWTIERACAAAGVSRQTVNAWAARGREPNASQEPAEFTRRLDEARAAGKLEREHGSAEEDENLPPHHPLRWTDLEDPFLAMEPERLAMLA